MLTRRGISTLCVAASLTLVGWFLVVPEIMTIGIAMGLVSVCSFASVWVPLGNRTRFTRRFATRGIYSGDPLLVELATEGTWTPTVTVTERLPGGRSVTAGLTGKGSTLGFETPPLHRGLNLIGPTFVTRSDFFGLFKRTSQRTSASPLIVWPSRCGVDPVSLRTLLVDPSQQPRVGVLKAGRPVAPFEGDLRVYVAGDEPRRIHWPSTARTGTLVVRTDASVVSDNRMLLTVDLDTSHHTHESFELTLSAAASLVLALLPVPSASLHREDSFEDDVAVEIIEGEYSPFPGRRMFRYPELLLDRLALAEYAVHANNGSKSSSSSASTASAPRARTTRGSMRSSGPQTSSSVSSAHLSTRTDTIRGGLLIGGPTTGFLGAWVGIRCDVPRAVVHPDHSEAMPPKNEGLGTRSDPRYDGGISPGSIGAGGTRSASVLTLAKLEDLPALIATRARSMRGDSQRIPAGRPV